MPDTRSQFPALNADTAREARTVYNLGNLYLLIGDRIDQLLTDLNLANLDSTSEIPVRVLTTHSLITIFQYAEGLPDRQAADATRTRMDWKYALHLPLDYPGLQPMSLCRFRQRLFLNPEGQVIFEKITKRIAAVGLLNRRENIGREALVVIRMVCDTNRLDRIALAFNQTLESLAARQSEWLRVVALPHWYDRYDGLSLSMPIPLLEDERMTLARELGSDARYLLEAARDHENQAQTTVPEIQYLGRVFQDHFYIEPQDTGSKSEIHWKPDSCAQCISFANDPY